MVQDEHTSTPFSIGVVGGGTAGYFAALTLRARRPDVAVTLLESPNVPPIGVGEGTTPTMPAFLHGVLGFDVGEFFRVVRPTWKLGVRLDWVSPGRDRYLAPFACPATVDSYLRTGSINHSGLAAELMNANRGLHERRDDGDLVSLSSGVPFAYHLDNRRLVAYLRSRLAPAGVEHIDAHVVSATRCDDGGIGELVAADGRRFRFDLYVDCTGFGSRLLGDVLGVGFRSFRSSLATDAALFAKRPHAGDVEPFTDVVTMDAGWCWNVPQLDAEHRGYVFSTDHLDVDAAAAEFERRLPGLGEPRLVRFHPGRRERWWHHNVVAIGNASGFVEPLLATSLNVIARESVLLASGLEDWRRHRRPAPHLNNHVASIWDSLRAVIAVHYRYNRNRTTPFWADVRASTDLGDLDVSVLDEAMAVGSLASLVNDGKARIHLGAARDLDVLLLGMGLVEARSLQPCLSDDSWEAHCDAHLATTGRALSAAASASLVQQQPSLLPLSDARWYRSVLEGLQHPDYDRRGQLRIA